jgi:hypothetical protein
VLRAPQVSRGLAVGDLFNDGTPLVLRNFRRSGKTLGWLRVGRNEEQSTSNWSAAEDSGKTEIIKDLAVDEFYGVMEGQGIVPPEMIP